MSKDIKHNSKKSFASLLVSEAREDDASDGVDTDSPLKSFAHYTFEKLINEGGMKLILQMWDRKAARSIAVAQLRTKHQKADSVERLLHEARILSNLEHPNIVPLHEIGFKEDGFPYFTMKIIGGNGLNYILNKKSDGDKDFVEKYSLSALLEIYQKVCNGVSYAHAKGVVHFDLKPDNIRVNEYGEAVVLDWGCAFLLDKFDFKREKEVEAEFESVLKNLNSTNRLSGTSGYVAPEYCTKDVPTPNESADVYALGAVLYHILYLKRHFPGGTETGLMRMMEAGELPEFSAISHGRIVPLALISVCKKAMAADLSERYETVSELRNEIDAYVRGYATRAENATLINLSILFIRRQKKMLSVAVGFLATVSLLFFSQNLYVETREQLSVSQGELKFKQEYAISAVGDMFSKITEISMLKRCKGRHLSILKRGRDARIYYGLARIAAAEFDMAAVLQYLSMINGADYSAGLSEEICTRLKMTSLKYLEKAKDGELSDQDKILFAYELKDQGLQSLCFLFLNSPGSPYNIRSPLSSSDYMDRLKTAILIFNPSINPAYFNFTYTFRGLAYRLDISKNVGVVGIDLLPLMGVPLKNLNLSGTLTEEPFLLLDLHFKQQLVDLDISRTALSLNGQFIRHSALTKLKARYVTFNLSDFSAAKKLTSLDIEKAKLLKTNFSFPQGLVKLNIAGTAYSSFENLLELKYLKQLVIDENMKIDDSILEKLRKRKVKIIINSAKR